MPKAELLVSRLHTDIIQWYLDFLKVNRLKGKQYIDGGKLTLELEGVSAHGMEPDKGKNAGLYLAKFLSKLNSDSKSQAFFKFVNQYFVNDSRGKNLGISIADEISGELTINVGKLRVFKTGGRTYRD